MNGPNKIKKENGMENNPMVMSSSDAQNTRYKRKKGIHSSNNNFMMMVKLFWGVEDLSPINEHKYKASVRICRTCLQRNSEMLVDSMVVNIAVTLKMLTPNSGTDSACEVPSLWTRTR